jgi:hypothetical protein
LVSENQLNCCEGSSVDDDDEDDDDYDNNNNNKLASESVTMTQERCLLKDIAISGDRNVI